MGIHILVAPGFIRGRGMGIANKKGNILGNMPIDKGMHVYMNLQGSSYD